MQNESIINLSNQENKDFTLGHNQFSTMSEEEWNVMVKMGGLTKQEKEGERTTFYGSSLLSPAPSTIDWVAKGAVNPIKNQGQCGSCWAFSAIGATEGINQITNNKLVSLSEQELVDCAGSTGNQGCQGGLMDNAFKWMVQNGGIDTEAD